MATDTLAAAQNLLETVARDLFSGGLAATEVGEPLVNMHKKVMKAADDESINIDQRRTLLVSFNIFRMTTAFIQGETDLVERYRNHAVRPYHEGLECDPELPLIWWFIGVLRHNEIARFVKVIESNPSALNSGALFAHRLISICLDALLDPRPTRP